MSGVSGRFAKAKENARQGAPGVFFFLGERLEGLAEKPAQPNLSRAMTR
jgi:hypothetical protein